MQKNLILLPHSHFNSNAGEMVSSEKFKSLVKMLRDHFDVIIMDTTPMSITSEPLALCELVDGVIFVCRSGVTTLGNAKEAIEHLYERHIKVGTILNGVNFTLFEKNRYLKYNAYYQGKDSSKPEKTSPA